MKPTALLALLLFAIVGCAEKSRPAGQDGGGKGGQAGGAAGAGGGSGGSGGAAGDGGGGAGGGSGGAGGGGGMGGGGGAAGGSGMGGTGGTGGIGDAPSADAGLDGPLACGATTCGADQVCVHPCCGSKALCMPPPDGGACPPGWTSCTRADGAKGCAPPCTPEPPFCKDVPAGCAGVPTCSCLDWGMTGCNGPRRSGGCGSVAGRDVTCACP